MAARPARTGATDPYSAKVETCHCDALRNAGDPPDKKHCLFPCENLIPKDWAMCRPCAKGNHTGKPCRQFVPDPVRHLVVTCADCGYQAPGHERGSDGRPFGD